MSKKCLPGSFWSNLQDACIPIMDLIDWQRSHPDNVYNISGTYGIDAAWKYFVKVSLLFFFLNNLLNWVITFNRLSCILFNLQSLKSVTADIGRDIHKRHLFMAADCLSVTGEFHGLSTKGLRQQRNDMSISSPFAQACLSVSAFFFHVAFYSFISRPILSQYCLSLVGALAESCKLLCKCC